MNSTSNNTLLDPFDLLGVTIDSRPEDAKAAFRAIALVAHPDKGGRPEEMKMLIKSYNFVMRQLKLVNRTNTVDDLEREFSDFCRSQKDEEMDLRSRELRELIMGEEVTNALEAEEEFREKFNAEFEERMQASIQEALLRQDNDTNYQDEEDQSSALINEAFMPQTKQEGYGANMMQSEYAGVHPVPEYKDLPPVAESISTLPSVDRTKNALDPGHDARALVIASNLNIQLSRFYGNARPSLNQHASDYAEAFGSSEPLAPVPDMSGTLEERLERLRLDRAFIP
jgi:curved DNA-binding protein CbpA